MSTFLFHWQGNSNYLVKLFFVINQCLWPKQIWWKKNVLYLLNISYITKKIFKFEDKNIVSLIMEYSHCSWHKTREGRGTGFCLRAVPSKKYRRSHLYITRKPMPQSNVRITEVQAFKHSLMFSPFSSYIFIFFFS